MPRRVVSLAALLLAAWTMGLELAHVLEWPPKAGYPGRLYTRLQESLYVWFGNIGGVIFVLAVVAGVTWAFLVRHERSTRVPVVAAAGAELLALVVFLTVVYPVNFRFPVHGPGAVPDGWEALRDRWELGHTAGFVLFTVAFVLLLVVALRSGYGIAGEIPTRQRARTPAR